MAWLQKPGSSYFEENQYAHHFEQRRADKILYNSDHRPGPAWTEEDEIKLVNHLYTDWYGEPYFGNEWTYNQLNLDAIEAKPLRRRELSPFKIDYETYAEIKLRLLNTVISIKGHPFLVAKIKNKEGAGWQLALTNGGSNLSQISYSDIQDLRTIPPMYAQAGSTGWLCRIPGRVYQQGINRHNTLLKDVASQGHTGGLDVNKLVRGLGSRQLRRWDETMSSLVSSGDLPVTRLSDDIAVKRTEEGVIACYRGRALGKIKDNDVLVNDEDDLLQQWISRSAKEVNLELRPQG